MSDFTVTAETPRAPALGRPLVRPREPAAVAQTTPKVVIKDVRFFYKKYEALAQEDPNVQFVGRLATYRYYNMDQVVGQALAAFRRIAEYEGRATIAAQSAARAIAAN